MNGYSAPPSSPSASPNSASTARGVSLLLCYTAGLGLPFVLSAVLIDQLRGAFTWVKEHYGLIDRVSGALLVVLGVLMATGTLGR